MEVVGPPPQNLVARLDDDQHATPGGDVAWRTWWGLCWDPYPGATSYELQAVTGEGASPRLRSQLDECLRVEAAAGEAPPDSVAARRATSLAVQEGQLAYRVRAVLDGGRRSEWSAPQAVGRPS